MGGCSGKDVLKVSQSVIQLLHSLLETNTQADFDLAKRVILELTNDQKLSMYKPKEREQIYALLAKLMRTVPPVQVQE